MIYGSVCSGIEAASVAWHPLGWRASFLSEIEAFPRAVLSHHFPTVPLHGDFTTIEAGQYDPVDLLVGGTPCQDFSVAGLRAGMAGDRGNLTLQFLTLARRLRPRWVVWENVPGVLSSNGGRDFGAFLGGLGELGYGWAYRTLDAQYFGVAQRRRRVFVVGCLGDWRRAAAVLFERHSLQGHPAPSREAGAVATQALTRSLGAGGADDNRAQGGFYVGVDVAHTLKAEGFDASEDGTGRGTPIVPVAYRTAGDGADPSASIVAFQCHGSNVGEMGTLRSGNGALTGGVPFVTAFQASQSGMRMGGDVHPTLDSNNGSRRHHGALIGSAVRRLTPTECERLQGFPDGWTDVPYRGKPAADGPRYKALGNSMAVPVMAWIGRRIEMVEAVTSGRVRVAA